jgi:tRNA (cmo5U34)-methyltransferase
MVAELVLQFSSASPLVYDLGCSTGTAIVLIHEKLARAGRQPRLVGIDLSKPMLEKAALKAMASRIAADVEFIEHDLNDPIDFEAADAILMNLTLQFVRPANRDGLLRSTFDALKRGGCLIVVEKVVSGEARLDRVYGDLYRESKSRQGYSSLEISQKDESLKNVLVPYQLSENLDLLQRNGFGIVDVFFRWYNFVGILAVK